MKFYFLLFLFLIAFHTVHAGSIPGTVKKVNNNNPQKASDIYGNVSVKKWADGKSSAFSFTFDDSYMSQYTYALPILNQYGFKGTFFVIAGAVTDGPPQDWRYGYWWQFREMAAEGHEIGAHTITHPDLTTLSVGDINTPNTLTYELYQSKKVIEDEIPGYKCISLAYPYCSYNSTVENITAKYFEAARTCGDYIVPSDISGIKWYEINSEEPVFDMPRNTVADDQDEFQKYIDNVQNKSIDRSGWSVFFAHEVVPMSQIAAGDDTTMWYPVSTEWLTQLCEWAKSKSDSGQLWVATFGNVVRYIKERENFNYNIVSLDSNQVEISTSTGLDSSIYNYPVTVDISVPGGWKYADIQQGASHTTAIPLTDSTGSFVRVNIIPGKENIIISRGAFYTVSGIVTYDDSAAAPVPSVKIGLFNGQDQEIDSVLTNAEGKYQFSNIPNGNYTVSLFKSGDIKSVNSSDALSIIRYYSLRIKLDSLRMKAADLNGDNKINSTDALLIARRYTGRINKFSCPDWLFSFPRKITVNDSDLNINFKAITAGDISKF